MNFLEAHRIVHEFAVAVGSGCESKNDFFICTDTLPFEYDKDMIVSAFQIFIYHMIFFKTRTKEEYQQYYILYQANIERFISRSEVIKLRGYRKIIDNKNILFKTLNKDKIEMAVELYGQFMKKNFLDLQPYRIDDIFNTNLGEMQDYKSELLAEVKDRSDEEFYDSYDRAIELYAKKTYRKANIEWNDDYFYYFQDFQTLRSSLNVKNYEKYYNDFKDYILSNR